MENWLNSLVLDIGSVVWYNSGGGAWCVNCEGDYKLNLRVNSPTPILNNLPYKKKKSATQPKFALDFLTLGNTEIVLIEIQTNFAVPDIIP